MDWKRIFIAAFGHSWRTTITGYLETGLEGVIVWLLSTVVPPGPNHNWVLAFGAAAAFVRAVNRRLTKDEKVSHAPFPLPEAQAVPPAVEPDPQPTNNHPTTQT